MRTQWALEGATTALIIATAASLAAVFAVRKEWIEPTLGIELLIGAGAIVIVGAVLSAARRINDEQVARRIDRASNLSDRLSTAIAFSNGKAALYDEELTADLVELAIKDGVRAAPRANIRAAAPFMIPADLKAAFGFIILSALVAGLMLPTTDRTPKLTSADPDHAPPGTIIKLHGSNLMTGVEPPLAMLNTKSTIGAPDAEQALPAADHVGFVPGGATVRMSLRDGARDISILDWTGDTITVEIPKDAPYGDTNLFVKIGDVTAGPVPFTVVDPKDTRYHAEKSVTIDPDEKQYIESILAELHNVAQRDKVPELEDFAKKLEQLLKDAEEGKITKEQLLDALSKAEDALNKDAEPNQAEVQKKMAEMGKELAQNQTTKELGEALQKNDLEKAKEELEKIAEKLANKQLSEKEKEELQKKLEQVAKMMEKQTEAEKKKTQDQRQKLEEEIRRLEKQKQEAKNDKERLDAERRLEDKKRDLEKLDKDEQQKQQSEQRRALERLEKDMKQAAENLEKKPNKDGEQKDADQQERERQASQNLKDAARETGKVDQDQRKQGAQRKMSSQMDDLREAMRRAKQKSNKGPQDPFNKNGKNQDFANRSKGGKGNSGQWKPGQGGQGQGQGQNQGQQNGGNGQGQPQQSSTWGTGHDDNLTGDPTQKTGNEKDQDVTGKDNGKGTSRRETILAAAQKGFSSQSYQKVYADYQRIVEEVMRTEKLPSSYKYYVKRYFAKIHPN